MEPKAELSEVEVKQYEQRAGELMQTERPEVLFAVAARFGFVDNLGGSEYRTWAEDQKEDEYFGECPVCHEFGWIDKNLTSEDTKCS